MCDVPYLHSWCPPPHATPLTAAFLSLLRLMLLLLLGSCRFRFTFARNEITICAGYGVDDKEDVEDALCQRAVAGIQPCQFGQADRRLLSGSP
jgi:hypothetical protein